MKIHISLSTPLWIWCIYFWARCSCSASGVWEILLCTGIERMRENIWYNCCRWIFSECTKVIYHSNPYFMGYKTELKRCATLSYEKVTVNIALPTWWRNCAKYWFFGHNLVGYKDNGICMYIKRKGFWRAFDWYIHVWIEYFILWSYMARTAQIGWWRTSTC